MAGGSLGVLTLDLIAKTGGFVDGLDKAERSARKKSKDIEDSFSKVGAAAAAAAVAAAVGIGALVKSQIDAADATSKAAASAGVTTEQFSSLSYAMKLGVDGGGDLSQTLLFLNKAIGGAAEGARGNVETFKQLGVEYKNADGTMRNASDVMTDVAEKFSGMEDGAGKAKLATELFGKSGADLIPLLNGGAAGLREAATEAERFGLVIGQDTASAAEQFNDNLSRVGAVVSGFGNEVMKGLLPALNSLGDEFVSTAKDSGALESAAAGVVGVFKGVVTVGVTAAAILKNIGNAIGAVAAATVSALSGDFKSAAQIMSDLRQDSIDSVSDTMSRVDAIWSASAGSVEKAELKKQAAIMQTATVAAKAAGGSGSPLITDKDIGSAMGRTDRAEAEEKATADRFAALQASQRSELQILEQRFAEESRIIDDADALLAEKDAARLASKQAYEEEWSRIVLDEATSRNDQLYNSEQERADAEGSLNKLSTDQKLDTAKSALGLLSTLNDNGSKKAFEQNKKFALADAAISMYQGIAAGVKLGYPMAIPAVAAAAATGAAAISNISKQKFGGGAAASPAVSNGAASSSGGGSAAPAQQTQRTNVTLVGDTFSRESIIQMLNSAFKDGYTLSGMNA